jgi:hypothetical protein
MEPCLPAEVLLPVLQLLPIWNQLQSRLLCSQTDCLLSSSFPLSESLLLLPVHLLLGSDVKAYLAGLQELVDTRVQSYQTYIFYYSYFRFQLCPLPMQGATCRNTVSRLETLKKLAHHWQKHRGGSERFLFMMSGVSLRPDQNWDGLLRSIKERQ